MEERRKVILDAGHGGIDPGAVFQGRQEKDDNLRLALAVGQILENSGVDVAYTRVSDVYNTSMEKAEIANRSGADYFVSLHRNAMDIPGSASGSMTLVYENSGVAGMLANNINSGLEKAGFTNLGTFERPGLILLRRTSMPAVLVEAGFIDNEADNCIFDQNFDQIAQGIADGIIATINEEAKARPMYYQIQVAAFPNREQAVALENQLKSQGFPAWLKYEDGMFKVRVGAYLNLDNAARMEQSLKNYGYTTYMVKEYQEKPMYYQIQVAAFPNREQAVALENQLKSQGFPAWLKYEDGMFKVRVGAYLDFNNAASMEQTLKNYGYTTYMLKE